jgi:hypothetical protein
MSTHMHTHATHTDTRKLRNSTHTDRDRDTDLRDGESDNTLNGVYYRVCDWGHLQLLHSLFQFVLDVYFFQDTDLEPPALFRGRWREREHAREKVGR